MKDIVKKIVKKIIIAICIIYVVDRVAGGLNLFIPINYITVVTVSILGVSGLLALIAINYML